MAVMDETISEILRAAPAIRRLGLRVLPYDLGDGGTHAYSINGIEPSHMGVCDLEDGLRSLATLAHSDGLCIQVEIDIAADPDGNGVGYEMLSEAESHAMQVWFESVGFGWLGETPSGLSARLGVDTRPSLAMRPH